MMESSDIFYHNPQGLATSHTKNDFFNLETYRSEYEEKNLAKQLLFIAKKEMNITDFSENKSLKEALLQAYNLGYNQIK